MVTRVTVQRQLPVPSHSGWQAVHQEQTEAPHHGADRNTVEMETESKASQPTLAAPARRTREDVLQEIKVAIAQERNYGREARARGANPYDSNHGMPQQCDIWGSKRRPT